MKTKPKDKDEHYDRRKKGSDEFFCYSCGSVIKKSSSVCPKCSTPMHVYSQRKEKETAILLALFTSFFVWLYLYEKSSIKFWTGLIFTGISILLAKLLYYAEISSWYLGLTPTIIIWIFAIIDVSTKEKNYFNSFMG